MGANEGDGRDGKGRNAARSDAGTGHSAHESEPEAGPQTGVRGDILTLGRAKARR
jgi:hypothetical protein